MTHEKIIKREDGGRVKILINFYTTYIGDVSYKTTVLHSPKGKRNWFDVDKHPYRGRNAEYEAFIVEQQLKYVTKQEILEAKLELWEQLKPVED